MKIREPEREDLPGLLRLIRLVYEESPIATTFTSRPTDMEIAALISRKIEGVKKSGLVDLVAVSGKRIIADSEIVRTEDGDGLVGIIVAKKSRRKGVGRMLLKKCAEKARASGISRIRAEINSQNDGAIAFFSKCGFRNRLENEGKVIMTKALSP